MVLRNAAIEDRRADVGIDGIGGRQIDGIDGDPSSVIGISQPLVRRLLTQVGVDVADLWSAER